MVKRNSLAAIRRWNQSGLQHIRPIHQHTGNRNPHRTADLPPHLPRRPVLQDHHNKDRRDSPIRASSQPTTDRLLGHLDSRRNHHPQHAERTHTTPTSAPLPRRPNNYHGLQERLDRHGRLPVRIHLPAVQSWRMDRGPRPLWKSVGEKSHPDKNPHTRQENTGYPNLNPSEKDNHQQNPIGRTTAPDTGHGRDKDQSQKNRRLSPRHCWRDKGGPSSRLNASGPSHPSVSSGDKPPPAAADCEPCHT